MVDELVKRSPGRGRFVSFEGGEGSGKSTQIKRLAERLNAARLPNIVTREPGGSVGAEIMRHLVLSGMGKLLGPDAETLLFAAARDDHVKHVIEPALAQGTWVLCDRFSDSTRAYQGKLGHVSPTLLNAMLKEIGIDSYYFIVNTVRGSILETTPANLGFNHAILAIALPPALEDPSLLAVSTHGRGPQLCQVGGRAAVGATAHPRYQGYLASGDPGASPSSDRVRWSGTRHRCVRDRTSAGLRC